MSQNTVHLYQYACRNFFSNYASLTCSYHVIADEVRQRLVRYLIGSKELVDAIADVDEVMFALWGTFVWQSVAPDLVAEADHERTSRLVFETCLRLLSAYHSCRTINKQTCEYHAGVDSTNMHCLYKESLQWLLLKDQNISQQTIPTAKLNFRTNQDQI